MKPSCPACGGKVFYTYACHTYQGGTGVWMSCMPCDSAAEYSCYGEDCDWSYTHGLNPKNPRAQRQEERRPDWLPEKPPIHPWMWTHPEVEHWDYADE